ncbi:uncharacterized protein LOC131251895 [Magnolia sinica]|uniref:uncharacterized protein LOC131251895 n=1 Tax=Magnolia sinica TaxID=86752 RepID=UPI00265B4F5F|nr:uncharacterized protein LOC131251895 [Magnolia sinica]
MEPKPLFKHIRLHMVVTSQMEPKPLFNSANVTLALPVPSPGKGGGRMGIKRLRWFTFTFAEKMEGDSREGESCQQFLNLIPNERDWLVRDRGSFQVTEEKKLELRIGPPGVWISKENCSRERLLYIGYFPKAPKNSNSSVEPEVDYCWHVHSWFHLHYLLIWCQCVVSEYFTEICPTTDHV